MDPRLKALLISAIIVICLPLYLKVFNVDIKILFNKQKEKGKDFAILLGFAFACIILLGIATYFAVVKHFNINMGLFMFLYLTLQTVLKGILEKKRGEETKEVKSTYVLASYFLLCSVVMIFAY